MRKACVISAASALLSLAPAEYVFAQTTSATLTGRILDPRGAPAPAITVSVTGQGTGVSRTAVTDTNGLYVLSNLPPGVVDLGVTATGFAEISRKDLALEVGRTYSFDFRLTVGGLTETVDVRNVVGVDTSRSVVDAVISTSLIDALPLNGRNFMELALLVPGNAPAPTSIRRR